MKSRYGEIKQTVISPYLVKKKIVLKKKRLLVCESKFTSSPIGVSVIDDVEDKIKNLNSKSHFSVSPILISAQGATKEVYQVNILIKLLNSPLSFKSLPIMIYS